MYMQKGKIVSLNNIGKDFGSGVIEDENFNGRLFTLAHFLGPHLIQSKDLSVGMTVYFEVDFSNKISGIYFKKPIS